MKQYKFKPGNKIVHNDTKEVKKLIRINMRTNEYYFKQEGTTTFEKIDITKINDNYEIYKLENIWDNL